MDRVLIEFLRESNAIEREYSDEALEDSKEAWSYAANFIPAGRKIDIPMIKTVHKFLLKRLDSRIAGKIRKVQVGVMTKEGFKEAIPHKEINEELRILCNPGIYPILSEGLIKRWHVQFEHIHPFEDGNGRVGRILMNIQRLKIDLPILTIHEGKEQKSYYEWFR